MVRNHSFLYIQGVSDTPFGVITKQYPLWVRVISFLTLLILVSFFSLLSVLPIHFHFYMKFKTSFENRDLKTRLKIAPQLLNNFWKNQIWFLNSIAIPPTTTNRIQLSSVDQVTPENEWSSQNMSLMPIFHISCMIGRGLESSIIMLYFQVWWIISKINIK